MSIWTQYREPKFIPEVKDTSYLKVMLRKLKVECHHGRITNEWECDFIEKMFYREDLGLTLSDKQKAKIEELFSRY